MDDFSVESILDKLDASIWAYKYGKDVAALQGTALFHMDLKMRLGLSIIHLELLLQERFATTTAPTLLSVA